MPSYEKFLSFTVILWNRHEAAAVIILSEKAAVHEPIKRVYVQKVKEIVEAEYYDKK